MSTGLSDLPLAAIAEAVDSDAPVPGGGAVAACTGALASALAGMAARFSARSAAQPGQFSALADQAAALRSRCLQLADDDAKAYAAYVAAARMPREPDPQPRQQALRAARDEAAAVPLELSATAAEIARLAGELTLSGSERMQSDSATAALLAAAVASSAAIFVAENLRDNPADPRVGQARAAAGAATAIARQSTAGLTDQTPERRSR
jgi:formiminotetrahydrofolate cyclodeaminase